MLDPITYTIEVPCNQETAFTVFVDMGSWWPLDKRSMSLMGGGQPAKSLQVDGTEHLWGTIKSFNPHDFISMDFHMGLPPETASLVEVRFTILGDD